MNRILVIGGGIMGTSVGLQLARAGHQVTIIERGIPGAEASTAAAGMLAPQMEAQADGPGLTLGLKSRELYPAWITQLTAASGVDPLYVPSGALQLAFDAEQRQGLEAQYAWQRARGLDVALLSGDEARRLEPALSPAVDAALHLPREAQVDPVRLMRALTIAAARAGCTFTSGLVRGLVERGGQCVGVDVDGQQLPADTVVVAAGAWTPLVGGSGVSGETIRPMRGQMAELDPKLPLHRCLLKSPLGYLVPRQDGRVIAGSTMEFAGFDKAVTVEGLAKLLAMAQRVVPALSTAPVTGTWSGLRPWTQDTKPIISFGHLRGLILATGHFRNGILLAPVTALLVEQLLTGTPPAVDLAPFRADRFGSARA